MSTRRQHHIIQNIIRLLGQIPAYITAPLAVAIYFGLHHITSRPTDLIQKVHTVKADDAATSTVIFFLAMVGQYALPLLLLAGSALWGKEYMRRRRVDQIAKQGQTNGFGDISWQDFEAICGHAFAKRGYRVEMTNDGADGGIDLKMWKNNELSIVQCKHWKSTAVSVDTVRELYGVLTDLGAVRAYLVASGNYTVAAQQFVKNKNIFLIAGDELRGMLSEGSQGLSLRGSLKLQPQQVFKPETVKCPRCRSEMVLRTSFKGTKPGSQFFGCSQYPDCKETLAAD